MLKRVDESSMTLLELRMPAPGPGQRVLMEGPLTVTVPTVPVPYNAPAESAIGLPDCEPLTNSVPPVMAVVPVYVLFELSVRMPAPALLKPFVPEIMGLDGKS